MIVAQLRALARSLTGRGLLAGALGGLVLTSLFLQAHGASLNRYALNRGKPAAGYLVVWLLALAIGALFGRYAGRRAARDLAYALGRGLLIGLGWFVLASCLMLPVLRGVHPFSLDPSVGSEIVLYLVYGMLLGVGYYQIGELVTPVVRQPRARVAGPTATAGAPAGSAAANVANGARPVGSGAANGSGTGSRPAGAVRARRTTTPTTPVRRPAASALPPRRGSRG